MAFLPALQSHLFAIINNRIDLIDQLPRFICIGCCIIGQFWCSFNFNFSFEPDVWSWLQPDTTSPNKTHEIKPEVLSVEIIIHDYPSEHSALC